MRLECEKLEECEATPELIRELVRNGAKRGEFMIMMRDDDREELAALRRVDRVFSPSWGAFERTAAMKRWHKAVERVRDWAQD